MEIECRNVNDAYYTGMNMLKQIGKEEDSRNGKVLVYPEPVLTIYQYPMERVLFHPGRDANPFFHLFEAMWMLCGRDDVNFLKKFNAKMGDFSDDNKTLYGAYGYRWVKKFHINQLTEIVQQLKADPMSRRAVLSMWETVDLVVSSKDKPCNTHVYFRVIDGKLEMTVCCRSNDIIWGAYGANSVHFSILQEFIAAGVGVAVGKMYQLSNNYHAYVDLFNEKYATINKPWLQYGILKPTKIVEDYWSFIHELREAMDIIEFKDRRSDHEYHNPFLDMLIGLAGVWNFHKKSEGSSAMGALERLSECDWTLACKQWLERRHC